MFDTEVELLRANSEIAKGRQHISHLSRENSSLKRDLEKINSQNETLFSENSLLRIRENNLNLIIKKLKDLTHCNYNHNGMCTIGKPCSEVTPNQCMCYKQGYRGGFTYSDTDSIKKLMNVSCGDCKSENTKKLNLEFENDDLKKQVKQLVETVATLVDYMK